MLEWISWVIIGIVNFIVDIYIFKKYIKFEIKCNKIKTFILFLFFSIIQTFVIQNCNPILRIFLNIVFEVIIFKILFNTKITRIILLTILYFIGYSICELIYSLIFVTILNCNLDFFKTNIIGLIFTNIVIISMTYSIFSLKFIKKYITNILDWYEGKDVINNIILVLMSYLCFFFFLYQNYTQNLNRTDFYVIVLFFIGLTYVIINLFKEKIYNIRLSSEYDQMIKYVKTYEDVIEAKNKEQHEYSNQLLLIKSMLKESDKKIAYEIDKRLKKIENEKDYKWLENIKNIPVGGLKGLVFYKINEMLESKINVYVDIDNSIDNKKIKSKCNKNLEDISKIIAIFIDNASQAAQQTNNKYVMLEAKYEKSILQIAISNTYTGNIDIEKFGQKNYTTKGKNHGYGLSVVSDILKKYECIKHLNEFNGMYFIQKLEIEIN